MGSAARWTRLLAPAWLGALLTLALVATPAAFALLPRADAGRVAGRMLAQEAYFSLAVGAVCLLLERRSARISAERGTGSTFSTNIILVLGTVFCTVAGYFGVLPLMAQARAGTGPLSFGQLHAVSATLFAIKSALVAMLAWRVSRQPSS